MGDGAGQWNGWTRRLEQNHISRPVGRRWTIGIGCRTPPLALVRLMVFAVLVLLTLCASAEARDQDWPSIPRPRYGAFVRDEDILFDHGPPPSIPWGHLEKRQEKSSADTNTKTASLSRPTFGSTATALPSAAASSAASAASSSTASSGSDPTDSPLPKPFDGGFGTNYTQSSCPTFLKSFLTNDTFTSCLPFSLLLQVRKPKLLATLAADPL